MNDSNEYSLPIGIDLGTTYSCVAVWNPLTASIDVIPNETGERTTPSFLAFIDQDIYHGTPAKSWFQEAPPSTIWEMKRFIGRSWNEPSVADDTQRVSYQVQKNPSNERIELGVQTFHSESATYDEKTQWITPIKASSILLQCLKEQAEQYLKQNIRQAVITVPAYFGEPQREATKLAGEMAGLQVLRVIPEPTAAALSYYQAEMKETSPLKNILVFDWGGGTLDVSILGMEGGVVEVLSIAGDHHLGGEDIDHILLDRVWSAWVRRLNILQRNDDDEQTKQEQEEKEEKLPILSDRELAKLRITLERAKRTLSTAQRVRIDWDPYPALLDFYQEQGKLPTPEQRQETKKPFWLTREQLEDWCEGIFHRALKPVDDAVFNLQNKLNESQISSIILVGGSTRIPAIQDALRRRFPNATVEQSIHPDECVAIGAALQATQLAGIKHHNLEDVLLLDALPFSLGLETVGGVMTKLLDRNTTLPAYATQTFTTYTDDQDTVEIQIYQGERAFACDNILLGQFELSGIPPAPRGQSRIAVSFTVDTNGILEVKAEERTTGHICSIQVKANAGNITPEEREQMIQEAEEVREKDEQRKQQIEQFQEIEEWLYRLTRAIQTSPFQDHPEVSSLIKGWNHWLQEHTNTPTEILQQQWDSWQQSAQQWRDLLQT